jgi:predicted phage baseplate assembly protein
MPLPDIQLDDRAFEDIVADARRRIPTYTPEWTDLNDSDPGVTLLQLFAWLSEMILYRLNKVPDKNYLKFLDLVGIIPNPPQPATAELTVTLTTKDPTQTVLVRKGTRVALSAPVDGGPVVFETSDDLNAVATSLAAVQGFDGGMFTLISDADHPLGASFYPFGRRPQASAALYLGFDLNFPTGPQRFRVHVDTSGLVTEGAGIVAGTTVSAAPPVLGTWEYWAGDTAKWQSLDVTSDTTGALVNSGDVLFNAPSNFVASRVGLKQRTTDPALFWIRFRIVQILGNGYETPPLLQDVVVNTVDAANAVTVTDELLGAADGTPGQAFPLANTPVLPDTLTLQVDEGSGFVTWTRVADFAGSSRTDTHYTLDPASGLVTFGDGQHGKIPLPYPITSTPGISQDTTDSAPVANVKAAVYQWGGGARGNAGANTIVSLQSTVPFVASVTNLRPSIGGADPETLDSVRLRAPSTIRSGSRAVTADDFETLAVQTPGAMVGRAKALPLYNPTTAPIRPAGAGLDATAVPVPGVVTVVVIPASREVKPIPSAGTLQVVGDYLRPRCPVATELFVIAPSYRQVEVDATVIAVPGLIGGSIAGAVTDKLLAFFHPLTGGVQGTGWGFGEPISVSEVYRQILTTPGVDRIAAGHLTVLVDGKPVPDNSDVALAPYEVVYSESHTITVRYP